MWIAWGVINCPPTASASFKIFQTFFISPRGRTADVPPPLLNSRHVKMKNNLKLCLPAEGNDPMELLPRVHAVWAIETGNGSADYAAPTALAQRKISEKCPKSKQVQPSPCKKSPCLWH